MCPSRRAAARSVRRFSLKLPHADGETCCSRDAVAMIDATMARRAVSDLDIYRAANLLIQRHGRDVVVEAGRLVGLMLDRGDMEGRQVWLRVRRAIVPVASDADRPHAVTATWRVWGAFSRMFKHRL